MSASYHKTVACVCAQEATRNKIELDCNIESDIERIKTGYVRVRNSANPCVRDMSKSLRTCQMSVHGYPVDMSIFCNLQLGLLELQEETPQADINQDNVMYLLLACCKVQLVAQSQCSRAAMLLLGDNTRFSHDRRWDGACSRDASGRRFPNPSASRARRFCSS